METLARFIWEVVGGLLLINLLLGAVCVAGIAATGAPAPENFNSTILFSAFAYSLWYACDKFATYILED